MLRSQCGPCSVHRSGHAASCVGQVDARRQHGYEATNGTGCWLFFARGAGLYVRLGRVLQQPDHAAVLREVRAAPLAPSSDCKPLPQSHPTPNPPQTKVMARPEERPNSMLLDGLAPNKEHYPLQAARRGFDAVAMGGVGPDHAQLVLTALPCMTQPRPIRACLPPEVPLFTGWGAARRPCACDDTQQTINCAATGGP